MIIATSNNNMLYFGYKMQNFWKLKTQGKIRKHILSKVLILGEIGRNLKFWTPKGLFRANFLSRSGITCCQARDI